VAGRKLSHFPSITKTPGGLFGHQEESAEYCVDGRAGRRRTGSTELRQGFVQFFFGLFEVGFCLSGFGFPFGQFLLDLFFSRFFPAAKRFV
jgi:hypothetical protein